MKYILLLLFNINVQCYLQYSKYLQKMHSNGTGTGNNKSLE